MMNRKLTFLFSLVFVVSCGIFIYFGLQQGFFGEEAASENLNSAPGISLPGPRIDDVNLGELIYQRRSVRSYADEDLPLEKVSDILWSTVGITVDGVSGPTRAVPSAGATDPLIIYLSVRRVEGLDPGVYRYHPGDHELSQLVSADRSRELAGAALGQAPVSDAPVVLIITAKFERTTARYGKRGERYVKIEAGHAAQNANLMAESMGLSGVVIGAFRDDDLKEALGGISEIPLVLLPLGRSQ